MARLYHRDQPGAPALAYSSDSAGQPQFEAFKIILKACLVSGYGAIPAAGWELIFESARSLILRNGTKTGYVCFQSASATPAIITVWIAASYSGVDAAGKIIGSGVRSGVSANSGTVHKITSRSLAHNSQYTTWSLVADAGTFVFSPSAATSLYEVNSTSGQAYEAAVPLYCGDDSAGDFIVMGGTNTNSTSTATSLVGFGSGGFTPLKFPDTGLLVDTQAINVATPVQDLNFQSSTFQPFPSGAVFPQAWLSPFSWISRGVVRNLRGVAADHRLLFAYPSVLSQALGGPVLTTRSISTPLDLGDGHEYVVARTYYSGSASFLLTTNPEFW